MNFLTMALCKDMAKFLLCFPKASITVFSAEAAHAYILYCVFRSGTIRKSVRAVDEKQDIFPCCGLIYCMLNWLKCHLVKYNSLIKRSPMILVYYHNIHVVFSTAVSSLVYTANARAFHLH